MKKILLVFITVLILLPGASLTAYEGIWGLNLDFGFNLPEIFGSSLSITQDNKIGAWYRGSWNQSANLEVQAGVGFDTDWIFGMDSATQISFHNFAYTIYPILNQLSFYGNTGIFGYRGGRFMVEDPAGLIVNSPMDGVHGSIDIGRHIFTAGVGFTGLVFGQSAQFFLTNGDSQRHPGTVLAAPRLIEYASWEMPSAAPWLNPEVYFLALQDLSSDADLAAYGYKRYHTIYLELLNRGFLGESFIYDVALVGQWGSYDGATVLAGMGRVGFSWRPTTRGRLGIEIMAATGDDWNRLSYQLGSTTETSLNQYLPVSTVSSRGYVVEFELGNMSSLAAFYNNRTSDIFSWEIRTTTFLRNAIGPVSSGLVSNTGTGNFIGQELLFGFYWQPKSDFNWNFKLGALYPGDAIVWDTFVEPYAIVVPRFGFDFSFRF